MVKNAKLNENPLKVNEKKDLMDKKKCLRLELLNIKEITEKSEEQCCDHKELEKEELSADTSETILYDKLVPNAQSHEFILQRMKLREIPKKTQKIFNLISIDLQTNLIRSMAPLSTINTLEIVDLSDNLIHKIELIENVKSLDLGYNLIQKIENLSDTLEHLYLMSNDIRQINNLPSNLITLDLAVNEITQIDNLSHLYKLEELYLGNNLIESLGPAKKEEYQNDKKTVENFSINQSSIKINIKQPKKQPKETENNTSDEQKYKLQEDYTTEQTNRSEGKNLRESTSELKRKSIDKMDSQLKDKCYSIEPSQNKQDQMFDESQSGSPNEDKVLQSLINCHTLSLQSNRLKSLDCSYLPPNLQYLCLSENSELKEITNLNCLKKLVYLNIWRTKVNINMEGVEILK